MALPLLSSTPSWVLREASVDLDFAGSRYFQQGYGNAIGSLISCSRASVGTNLLPSSSSGFSYTIFGSGLIRITPGSGLLIEEARTNLLLNSSVPVTQTTASLGTGTYTLWVNGSGSATSSAGTAIGSGFGVATNGSTNVITLTGAGTVIVTVSGSLNAFQLELGAFGTSFIPTTGVTAARAADVATLTNLATCGTAYTLFGQGTSFNSTSNQTNHLVNVSSNGGDFNNRAGFLRDGTSSESCNNTIRVGGVNQTGPSPISAIAVNVSGKMALAVQLNDAGFAASTTAAATTAALASIPATPNMIYFGTVASVLNNFWNGYIERVALWPFTRLSNASLLAITR